MYSHILIPTDGSALAGTAIEKGLQLARTLGAKVTVMTSMEPFHVYASEAVHITNLREEYNERVVSRAMAPLQTAAAQAAAAGVPCETVAVESERPFEGIVHAAEERGCDLIAMTSHGRGGMAAILIGSETMKVLTHSKIPVLVYR
jgi:Universal stress protein UspA and related nucleotide-binding proteins